MHLTVVHDDFQEDRIANLLCALGSSSVLDISGCRLSEFLLNNGFYFDQATSIFRVRDNNFKVAPNALLLSRVVDVSPQTVSRILGEGSGLFKGQVLWALQSASARYRNVCSTNGLYSSVGTVLPLPTQWAIFDEMNLPGITPKYIYSYGSGIFDISTFEKPIIKSTYDYYNWKPGKYSDEMFDRFAVEQPSGNPVITYVSPTHEWHVPLNGSFQVPNELISKLARGVWDAFGGLLLEILWFVDKESVTFGCASHYCVSLQTFDRIDGFVEEFQRLCQRVAADHDVITNLG